VGKIWVYEDFRVKIRSGYRGVLRRRKSGRASRLMQLTRLQAHMASQ